MKVLTLNAGSSSLKYKLFDAEGLVPVAAGNAERIGERGGRLIHRWYGADQEWHEREHSGSAPDHAAALELAFSDLNSDGVLQGHGALLGIGHRVVHGGGRYVVPTLIDDTALAGIRSLDGLAPLHNPANVRGIEVARRLFPRVPHVAVFDTGFHRTLPPRAFLYALPPEFHSRYQVRRYGFHGTSVQYVVRRCAELMQRPINSLNVIVLHLGNGASATAVENGQSLDTSMGMTPLEGLIMGSRCGDLDPAVHFHLLRNAGYTPDGLEELLFHRCGIKGICGTNDMREVHARAARGDEDAALALEMFCYRIKKYIGAYAAVLGRVDAIVFTAGIGEHDPEVRERSLAGLEIFGVTLDVQRNRASESVPRAIHSTSSKTQIWVIPTDEEFEMARSVLAILKPDHKEPVHE